eukprot:scaffold24_cov245-Pinguiococcus_pyrenoidosus.AAC.5
MDRDVAHVLFRARLVTSGLRELPADRQRLPGLVGCGPQVSVGPLRQRILSRHLDRWHDAVHPCRALLQAYLVLPHQAPTKIIGHVVQVRRHGIHPTSEVHVVGKVERHAILQHPLCNPELQPVGAPQGVQVPVVLLRPRSKQQGVAQVFPLQRFVHLGRWDILKARELGNLELALLRLANSVVDELVDPPRHGAEVVKSADDVGHVAPLDGFLVRARRPLRRKGSELAGAGGAGWAGWPPDAAPPLHWVCCHLAGFTTIGKCFGRMGIDLSSTPRRSTLSRSATPSTLSPSSLMETSETSGSVSALFSSLLESEDSATSSRLDRTSAPILTRCAVLHFRLSDGSTSLSRIPFLI